MCFLSTEDHLSGRGLEFDPDAGTSVSCSFRVNPCDIQESERRPVTHCEAFLKAVGSDGSYVQRDNFLPAAHETLAVVAQAHRVFPEGQPISQDQGLVAMLMCLRHVEETVVPVTRSCVGGSLFSCYATTVTPSQTHEWPLRLRSVGRSPSHVAHQLSGDAGSISNFETLSPRPERPSCVSTHR